SRDVASVREGVADPPPAASGCVPESDRARQRRAPNGPAASGRPPGRPPASAPHAGADAAWRAHASAVDAGSPHHAATPCARRGAPPALDTPGPTVAADGSSWEHTESLHLL